MNLHKARKILDVPEDFTPDHLKRNYRKLAKEYHPDKNPNGSSRFIEINEAYEYLLNNDNPPEFEQLFDFDFLNINILKNFFKPTQFSFKKNKEVKTITISPSEYFTGTVKELQVQSDCPCELRICMNCAGGGYCLNGLALEVCMECLGNGGVKKCKCSKQKSINVTIPPNLNLNVNLVTEDGVFKIKIDDNHYTFINNKLYYIFDITLKESLTGFTKTFNDPFSKEHTIRVKNTIVKQNDGYSIKFDKHCLILLFNIVYPKRLSKITLEKLREAEF